MNWQAMRQEYLDTANQITEHIYLLREEQKLPLSQQSVGLAQRIILLSQERRDLRAAAAQFSCYAQREADICKKTA